MPSLPVFFPHPNPLPEGEGTGSRLRLSGKTYLTEYWLRKAGDALQSARSEAQAGRLDFAVNRAYYACFYAASAVLPRMGKKFVKHSGLRAAVHQDLVLLPA